MRDVTELDGHTVYTITNREIPTVYRHTYPRLRAGRSNVIKSDGSSPTPYSAYRLEQSMLPFKFREVLYTRFYSWQRREWVNVRYVDNAHGTTVLVDTINFLGINPWTYLPQSNAIVENQAINAALKKLSNQKVNFSETILEARSTGRQMDRTLRTLMKSIKALRRGQFRKAAHMLGGRPSQIPETVAGGFLAWKLMAEPLVSDIFNGSEAILDLLGRNETRIRVTAERKMNMPVDLASYVSGHRFDGTHVDGCKVGITASIEDGFVQGLKTVGLINPIKAGWDAVPLSFVLDWFVDVGGFLESFSATHGLTYEHGYKTRYVKSKGIVTHETFTPSGALWQQRFLLARAKVNFFSFERKLLGTFPLPAMAIGKGVSNMTRASILLALATVR